LSIIPTISTKQKKVLAVIVNNTNNINKTKEKKVLAVIVNNTTNINKTKESFSRDCQ
jgi:hypothetical protein